MSGICVANMAPPEETYYSHIAHYSTKQKDIYYYIIIIIYYYCHNQPVLQKTSIGTG